MKTLTRDLIVYILIALVFIAGAVSWSTSLTADPPTRYCGLGQSLSTDPAHCVYHARNLALFGDSDPFDYPRWVAFQRSIVSLAAYIWFFLFSVSLTQSNMVGVVLALGALVFFILAMIRDHRPWAVLAFTACYLWNITMIVHGRVPYLENGLLLVMSAMFFIYSRWGDRRWGLFTCAALVSLAMLTGKLFGIVLLPALLLAEFLSSREHRARRMIGITTAFVGATVILILILYVTNLSSLYQYYRDGTYSLRGFPEGLTSPWAFVEHLIAYGFYNRLYPLGWDLLVFLLTGSFLLTYSLARGAKLAEFSRVTLLSIFVIPCIYVGLGPQNYSPLRYALFLIPAIIIFCFGLFDYVRNTKFVAPVAANYVAFIPLFFAMWHIIFQVTGIMYFINDLPMRSLTWGTLPAALAIVYFVRKLMLGRRFTVRRLALNIGAVAIVLFSMVVNASNIAGWLIRTVNHSIEQANDDLKKIVGEGAVISGPYAPALTVDNDLKSFIYYFGVAVVDSLLFQKYPITHLAMDNSNWEEAVQDYPELANATPSATYWIRDYGVRLYNISHLYGNPEASRYQQTAYEKAMSYYQRQIYDSAYIELARFRQSVPDCRSANLLWGELLVSGNKFDEALRVLTDVANQYPTDYHTNLTCGRLIQVIGILTKNSRLMPLAQKYYQRAITADHFKADFAQQMYRQTLQQLGAAGGTSVP